MTTRRTMPAARIGLILLIATVVATCALFSKNRISAALMSGDKVTVTFERAYKLRPFVSQVKVGYVPVGKVTGVEREPDGSARVELKVDHSVLARLGTAPSATIRPTTLLGGIYFVDLAPGGDPGRFRGSSIPRERTAVPVELDKVARSLQPDALRGAQSTLRNTDEFLGNGGDQALQRLMSGADRTLRPASRALDAAAGQHPETDLTSVVDGLENTARALTQRPGELESIVADLDVTASTLADQSSNLGRTMAQMPAALSSTRSGLESLDGSLVELRSVAGDTRVVARKLDSTLENLQPVLESARPMVADLRQVLGDARPLVTNLVPSASTAQQVVEDVRGPVIDRVNDDVLPFLSAKYHGAAPYAATRSNVPLYEEIALAVANVDRVTGMVDHNGHGVSFQPGPGTGSVAGLPISLEQMTNVLKNWITLDQPVDTLPPLTGPSSYRNYNSLVNRLLGGRR